MLTFVLRVEKTVDGFYQAKHLEIIFIHFEGMKIETHLSYLGTSSKLHV